MAYKKRTYKEIAKTPITEKRNLVISECSTGGYTIAQQSPVVEDNKTTYVFFRGSINVKDIGYMKGIRDCFNIAIKKIEEQIEEDKAWDDVVEE